MLASRIGGAGISGSPQVKTPCLQSRGAVSVPGLGTRHSAHYAALCGQKEERAAVKNYRKETKNNWSRVIRQFSSVAQSCPTLCNPVNRSMPGLPVHHQLPDSTQTHVHRVADAIQPSHPLSSPSPPALNLSFSLIYGKVAERKLMPLTM